MAKRALCIGINDANDGEAAAKAVWPGCPAVFANTGGRPRKVLR
ncbi:MAG: hypothetical protein ACK6BG_02980 [Cyanobacteriota bacterium]